jgi:hypothetical protein
MKNTMRLFGIIAIVAVIGFSMAACDPGPKDDDSTDPNPHDETTVGRLTITGLSAFNGKYAWGQTTGTGSKYYAQESLDVSNEHGLISNGSVTLKVWKVNSEGNLKSFNGNDSVEFGVQIYHEAGPSFVVEGGTGTVQITFASGIGTGAFVLD